MIVVCHILIIEPQLTAIPTETIHIVPLRGEQDMGASVKLKMAQAETCVAVPVSPSPMNLLPLHQICLGVWLLSSDQRGNQHFNEIPEKSICTSLPCPFLSLITAPQAEGI